MRQKIHRQLMRWQRFVVVVILLGISLFVLWARSRQIPLPVIIGSSIVVAVVALLAGGYYYKWAWTGFTDAAYPSVEGVEFHRGKTLWDWLQLLIIPSVLAGAALLFNAQSTQTQLDITTDNQREAALQAYIDKMSELLLNGKLRTSEEGSEIRSVARTRTLSALRQLDGTRKGQVLQFLYESQLISTSHTIIDLVRSDLSQANLQHANLEAASLYGANLQHANLQGAYLVDTHLTNADLQGADLRGADFHVARLDFAKLENAKLAGVEFWGASLYAAHLAGTDLSGANLFGVNLSWANLQGASLAEVNLEGVDLRRANLASANLTGANLTGTNIEDANLSGANLTGTTVTPEQLAQAASLKGATMPDGSIHD